MGCQRGELVCLLWYLVVTAAKGSVSQEGEMSGRYSGEFLVGELKGC